MGIAERAAKQGRIFQTINYVVNGKLAQRVPLGAFGKELTQFPYLLILEQSKTEQLLLFSKNNSEEKIKTIRDLVDKYSDVIQIEVISFSRATNDLYETFGVQNGGYYGVRPDMYIAYRSVRFDEEHLKAFLKRMVPSAL